MKDVINYDVSMMKEIAREVQILLRENYRDLRDMEINALQAPQLREQIRDLEKACRSYEVLTYNLTAAANIYGSAEAEAAETAAF